MPTDDDTRLQCLFELTRRCYESAEGYRMAGRHIRERGQLGPWFARSARRRTRFAEQLASYISAAGGTPPDEGTLTGTLPHAWALLERALARDDAGDIHELVAFAERPLLEAYERALDCLAVHDLARATIAAQLAEVRIAHGGLARTALRRTSS